MGSSDSGTISKFCSSLRRTGAESTETGDSESMASTATGEEESTATGDDESMARTKDTASG